MKNPALYSLLQMIPVKPGSFPMGSPQTGRRVNWHDEFPWDATITYHYELGRFPVTNLVWSTFTDDDEEEDPFLPKTNISWVEAVKFCISLNEHFDLEQPFYVENGVVNLDLGANGFRLPTETEWERACFDLDEKDRDLTEYIAQGNSPVGGSAPNALGFYDQLGNVGEWCWDWYAEKYLMVTNSTGRMDFEEFEGKVYRGLKREWGGYGKAARFYANPIFEDSEIGFRLARTARNGRAKRAMSQRDLRNLMRCLDEIHINCVDE